MMQIRRCLCAAVLAFCITLTGAVTEANAASGQVKIAGEADGATTRPAGEGKPVIIVKPVTEATTYPTSRPTTNPKATTSKTVEDCRKLYMAGRYVEAAEACERLAGDASLGRSVRAGASIGLAEALAMRGKYTEAIAALEAGKDVGEFRADWQVAMAEALSAVGRYSEALVHAARANELEALWAPSVLARGRLLETLGRKKEAADVYRSMEKIIDAGKYRSDARSLVALGLTMDRFAILTARRASEQAANILHNYLQEAYRKADAKYWPAHVAAGMFLLSKHKPGEAAKEFALAAELNKNIPDVHVAMAALNLGSWRFEDCMKAVDQALEINPNHADALLVKSICLMQWRKYEQAAAPAREVLKTNPNNLEALSLLAAIHIRRGEDDQAEPYIQRVRKINDIYADLPNTIGQWLAAERQFTRAEKYYKEAIALAPEQAEPVTNLGLMYMQTGDEAKAEDTLMKARKLDDFRQDILNYLSVLRELKTFKVKETKHFIVKVSAEHDLVLLDRVAAYAEEMYSEVCRDYEHEPSVKTIVEIFPTHPGFSKRISGRGWIGTIGASTGRVIAMVAPNRERSQFGTYNWHSVLRHEFAHTVTLSATHNRISHWFTEACAVWQQPDRQSYDAVTTLVEAVQRARLFPVNQLDWGFVRPKRRGDRGLAYAQSELIKEYIIETRGYPTIIAMLKGFGDGMTQTKIFTDIVGAGESEFDKSFGKWAREKVKAWGFEPDAPAKMKDVLAAVRKNPKDAGAHAAVAVAALRRRDIKQAEKSAQKALELDGDNTAALGVMAYLMTGRKEYAKAIELAERLENLDHNSKLAPRVLGQCYLQQQRWADGIVQLEILKLRRPLDPHGYEELAKIYMQLGLPDKALPNLIELHRRTMKDSSYARQIAEIYATRLNQSEQVLSFLEQITHINPYDASAYRAMTEIHKAARRYEKAVESAQDMRLANPESAESWTYVAIARYHLGKTRKDVEQLKLAREDAAKALEMDPNVPRAAVLMEKIDLALGTDKDDTKKNEKDKKDTKNENK